MKKMPKMMQSQSSNALSLKFLSKKTLLVLEKLVTPAMYRLDQIVVRRPIQISEVK